MVQVLFLLSLFIPCQAFQPLSSGLAFRTATRAWQPLYLSSSSGKKRRRVRRKDLDNDDDDKVEVQTLVTQDPEAPTLDLKPRDADTVEFKIQDVRDVLSGSSAVDARDAQDDEDDEEEWEYVDIDEEEDEEEYEYVIEDVTDTKLDSLEQLLADAKSMRADEKDAEKKKGASDEGGINVQDSVLKVLSTIVTIDFFVVIALLLWFLAGIFCSYVIKDDVVQIAFNNIFEPVVQPALGLLMIASAASSVLKGEEDEQEAL